MYWYGSVNIMYASAVFSGFSPRHHFLLLFCTVTVHELPPSQNHHALVSMLQRDSTHAYTCVGIPPAFNCWSISSTFTFMRGENYIFLPVWKFGSKSLWGKGLVLNIRQFLQRKPGIQCCGYNSLSLTWIL